MRSSPRIFVAGHGGMVGSALVRALHRRGHPPDRIVTRTRAELDLADQGAVDTFFRTERIDEVYLAAALVGGIHANATRPAEFIYSNLIIPVHVIHAAHTHGVDRLLSLGSSCIYPREAPQPMAEEALLTGPLEPTNEPYAVAKIAGIKLCESYRRQYGRDYRSVMPTNLYGPGDTYDPEQSHVIPALLRRFHEAKVAGAPSVTIWGTGAARREFLHVDDLAEACLTVMALDRGTYEGVTAPQRGHLNVGSGEDVTIRALAEQVAATVGYTGDIVFDASRPDGAPRKLMDSARLRGLGWRPRIGLAAGLAGTYEAFVARYG